MTKQEFNEAVAVLRRGVEGDQPRITGTVFAAAGFYAAPAQYAR